MSRIRRHGLSVVAPVALAATLLLVSCLDDPSGPGVQPGFLALAPHFESSAAGIVDVDSIHVTLIRDQDQTVALDTMVAAAADSGTVDLSFTVLVSSSGETFTLTLDCYSPAGEMVFSAGPLEVTATTSGSDDVVAAEVPIEYVGVGSNAASVQILGSQDTVKFGDTLLLQAEALDSSGAVIEGTPIKWVSHDTARVVVPDAGQGLVVGYRERGGMHVEALLLTGPADTVDVWVEPVASAVTAVSGDGQSGVVSTELASPVVVQVNAVDGTMQGVTVDFAVTGGGGSLGQASAITDASGQASTSWTLGATVGTQTMTASVGAIATTISATANTPFEPSLSFTVQPSTVGTNTSIEPAVVVTAYDGFGAIDTDFTGNITISIANNAGGGTLSGTTTNVAVSGVATFADLALDREGTGYTLLAAATGYVSTTSSPFNISRAQPRQVGWINVEGGNWSDGANWNTGVPPSASDTAVIVAAGEYYVNLDTDATVAVLVLGDGVNQQTMTVIGQTLTVTDSLHVNEVAFLGISGNIAGDGGIFVDGTLSWTTGTIGASTAQPLHIGVPGQFVLTGLDTKTLDQRQVVNYGATDWVQGDIVLTNGVTLVNEAGGQFGAFAEGSISGVGQFQNIGYFIKDGPDSTIVQVPFSNIDTLNVSAGYLVLDAGFTHAAGALLQGIGTLDITGATISLFQGDIGPGESPGILSVEGDLTLGANTTVFVELNGLSPGLEFDMLDVSGILEFAGTLDITMGFTPSAGDAFNVFGFTTFSGDFNTINGLNIGGGLVLDTVWNAGFLTLEAVTAGGQQVSWINASGGNWSTGANWSTGTVPTALDTVVINLAGTYTVMLDGTATVGAFAVGDISGSQTLEFSGNTLTTNGASGILPGGVLDIGTGSLVGSGLLVNEGTVDLDGGSIDVPFDNEGTVTAWGGATSTITGAITTTPTSLLRLNGNTGNDANLTVTNGFTNNGTIEFAGPVYNGILTVSTGTLTNAVGATIQTNGGNGQHEFVGSLDNQGTIDVANLSLRINNDGGTFTTMSGTLDVASGLTLTVNGGTGGGTTIAGTGTVTAGTGTIDLAGTETLSLVSDLTLPSGVSSWTFGGAVTVNGTGTLIVESTLQLNGDVVGTDLDIAATGTVTVTGGTASSITGAITTAAGSMLRLNGNTGNDANLTVTNGFTNNGTIEFAGPVYNGILTVSTGTLTNAVGATIQTNGGNGQHEFVGSINNQGTIDVADLSLRINNDGGTFTTTSGTLDVASGLTLTVNGGTGGGTTQVGSSTVTAGAGTIDLAGNQTLELLGNFTVPSGVSNWTFGGTVTVDGTQGTLIVAGTLPLSGDVVDGPLTITSTGTVTVTGGTSSSVNGTITTNTGSMLQLNGNIGNDANLTVAEGFDNNGIIEFTGTSYNGRMTVTLGTLTNVPGATIRTAGGSGLHEFTGSLDNHGTIEVTNLSLRINNDGGAFQTVDGTLDVAAGHTLTINGGTGGGVTEVGTATVTAGAGTIDLTGTQTLDIQTDFTVPSGVSTWAFGGSVTVTGQPLTTMIVEGALSLNGDVVNTDLDIAATGVVTVTGGAASSITGAITTAAGSMLRLNGNIGNDANLTVADGFTNNGTIEFDGTSYNGILTVSAGTLTNAVGAMIQAAGGSGRHEFIGSIDNQGTLDVANLSLRITVSTNLTNGGTTTVASGLTLTVTGGTFTNTAAGTFEGAGTLDVSGTSFTNSGAASPGTGGDTSTGVLTFDDNLPLPVGGSSSLNFDLNGLTVGSEYDRVVVAGPVTLGGTLNVTAGFTPSEGDTFTILTSTALDGTFDDIFLPGIGAGLDIDPVYTATSLQLIVVAIPPATDAIWEGTTSTDWNDGTNWSTGTVPTDVENVWIRQAPSYQPVVSMNTSVGSVVVQPGAEVTIDQFTDLAVYGDLDAGTPIVGDGTVVMSGSGTTLTGTVNNLLIQDNVTLSGPVSVTGVATVESGQLTLGGNTMTVAGAFSTGTSGVLVMNNGADVLNAGHLNFEGASTDGFLTAGTLSVTGSFSQSSIHSTTSFAASGTHRTVFNGSGLQEVAFENPGSALSRFMEMEAEGSATVALVNVSGNDAYVNGSLSIRGTADVNPGCQTIEVAGNLNTSESGTLTMMCDDSDYVVVNGDANFGGASTAGRLTEGELVVHGNFTQTGDPQSFAASGNHTTHFTGSTTQSISFASPDSANGSHFNNLEMRQTDGQVTLYTPVFAVMATIMDFDIATANPAVLNGLGEIIVGDGFTTQSDNTGVLVEPYAVRIGDYLSNQGTFRPTVTEFFGPGMQVVPSTAGEIYTDVIASGDEVRFTSIDIGGTLFATGNASFDYYAYTMNIAGDLIVSGSGTFTLWESNVTVGGDIRTEDSGTLSMQWASDVLDVNGNAVFGGGNSPLSDGTLSVAGNFTQATGLSAQSFAPGPSHVTVLNGTAAQQVTFESPTLNESRFGDLRIDNTSGGGIALNTPVLVRDDFLTPATAVTRRVFGSGNTLTTHSVDIQNMVFNNAPLNVLYEFGYTGFTDIDDVTFQSMDPTVTQLGIVREDEWGTFTNLTFSTLPTTGYYAHFDDPVDSGNNAVFTMDTPNPEYHGGFARVTGFAFLSGWPEMP